jgi:hypothetical protein
MRGESFLTSDNVQEKSHFHNKLLCLQIIPTGRVFRRSRPGAPDFDFTSEERCLPLRDEMENGVVEKWNIGYEKRIMA